MTDLDEQTIRRLAHEYERTAAFATVETAALETFPTAARVGDLRWRDIEWLVRWYYRRHLSSRYNREASRAESAFGENQWPTVKETIERAIELETAKDRVDALVQLTGIGAGIASGILYFTSPTRDIVMGEPEWSTLRTFRIIDTVWPDTRSAQMYHDYRDRCFELAETSSVDLTELQRALFQYAMD